MRYILLLLLTTCITTGCTILDVSIDRAHLALQNLEQVSALLDRHPAAKLVINIYDSPSDRTKVVVEVCGEHHCARLLTVKATLQADYESIQTWVLSVEPEL